MNEMYSWYIDNNSYPTKEFVDNIIISQKEAVINNKTVNEIYKSKFPNKKNPAAGPTAARDFGILYINSLSDDALLYDSGFWSFNSLILNILSKRNVTKAEPIFLKPFLLICKIFDIMETNNISQNERFITTGEVYEYISPLLKYEEVNDSLVKKIIDDREYTKNTPHVPVKRLEIKKAVNLSEIFSMFVATGLFEFGTEKTILKLKYNYIEVIRYFLALGQEIPVAPQGGKNSNNDLYEFLSKLENGIVSIMPDVIISSSYSDDITCNIFEYMFGVDPETNGFCKKYFKNIDFGELRIFYPVREILFAKLYITNPTLAENLVDYNNQSKYIESFNEGKLMINKPFINGHKKLDKLTKNSNLNEYIVAADIINNYINLNSYNFNDIQENHVKTRDIILNKFKLQKLEELSNSEMLEIVFYSQGDNTDSLCYFLERDKFCKKLFGGIAGGSAHKFGLFQKQDTGEWIAGSAQKNTVLSEAEAKLKAQEIVGSIISGAKIIEESNPASLEDYERMDDKLQEALGEYYNLAWIHKYFSILFPEKLSSYHTTEWQKHILRCYQINPSDRYYARSGQIAMIQNYAGLTYREFFIASNDKFGRVKTFYKIGSAYTESNKKYADEWRRKSVVALGWKKLGDLNSYVIDKVIQKDLIAEALQEQYYSGDKNLSTRKAGEIQDFYNMDKDSIALVADGFKMISLVDNLGEYIFKESEGRSHIRHGNWHNVFAENEKLPFDSEGKMTSCFKIKNDENIMFLYKKYYYPEENITEESKMAKETSYVFPEKREPRTNLDYELNQILYGAPGTGKTYSSAPFAVAIIEGKKTDEVLKEDRNVLMERYNEWLRSGRIVFTTFHQNYGYEDFIQGIRPDTSGEEMSFDTVDGVFKKIADRAYNDPDNNYVIVIDEINRANISKVFGELITLIEPDKRWGEVNGLCAELPSEEVFVVPNNLYIIGTMNSADKSISVIDAALRRRFEFIEFTPDEETIADSKLKDIFNRLNRNLVDDLGSTDLLIGHSYFMNKEIDNLPEIMNNNIIPLLYEYFFDDKNKVKTHISKAIENTGYSIDDINVRRLRVKKA